MSSGPEHLAVAGGPADGPADGKEPSRLTVGYTAAEVNLVMTPPHGAAAPARVALLQDNKPLPEHSAGDDVRRDSTGAAFVEVSEPRMYSLVRNHSFGSYTLELVSSDVGLALFAFTFVSCVAPVTPDRAGHGRPS